MAIYQLGDDVPRIAATAWVADSAQVIGRVVLGDGASIWYGAVLRGDNDLITVGERSSVQDGCVLHTDLGFPLTIGAEVSVVRAQQAIAGRARLHSWVGREMVDEAEGVAV